MCPAGTAGHGCHGPGGTVRRSAGDAEAVLGTGAAAIEEPAAAFATRLEAALADTSPLTSEQRRARAGLTTRQVTLR